MLIGMYTLSENQSSGLCFIRVQRCQLRLPVPLSLLTTHTCPCWTPFSNGNNNNNHDSSSASRGRDNELGKQITRTSFSAAVRRVTARLPLPLPLPSSLLVAFQKQLLAFSYKSHFNVPHRVLYSERKKKILRSRSVPTLYALLFTFLPYVAEELECTDREGERQRKRETYRRTRKEGEREKDRHQRQRDS